MLHSHTYKMGDLWVGVYDFDDVGDQLPLHAHDANSTHITIVARGSLKVLKPESEKSETIVSSGNLLDCNAGVWHGFEALEPKSRIINVIKKTIP